MIIHRARGPEWDILSRSIKSRDGYKCQLCGDNGKDGNFLVVHHKDKNPFNDAPNNMITLCSRCHDRMHIIND